MNPKNTNKSPIHENADANITCDFGDGNISRLGGAYLTHVIHRSLVPRLLIEPLILFVCLAIRYIQWIASHLDHGSLRVRSTNFLLNLRVTPPISMKFGTLADNA